MALASLSLCAVIASGDEWSAFPDQNKSRIAMHNIEQTYHVMFVGVLPVDREFWLFTGSTKGLPLLICVHQFPSLDDFAMAYRAAAFEAGYLNEQKPAVPTY